MVFKAYAVDRGTVRCNLCNKKFGGLLTLPNFPLVWCREPDLQLREDSIAPPFGDSLYSSG